MLTYDENGEIDRARDVNAPYTIDGTTYYPAFGSAYNKYGKRKLFLEERFIVARMGQLRYWKLLEKTTEKTERDKHIAEW